MEDGVYFNMDDATYHGIERLSASGIKNLMVSPTDFYMRSWLNKNRRDEQPADWAIFGTAFHKRVCEGKKAFDQKYVSMVEPEDFPSALVKNDELKEECRRLGLPVSGTKEAMSDRLRQFGCQNIWADIMEQYDQLHAGKTFLSKQWLFDIEIAAAMIEKHPTLCKAFQGGYPEVAILSTVEVEKADGSGEIVQVPMKSKCDYLKPQAIVDLKGYSNAGMKGIKRAITYEIAARRYAVQAAVYYQAYDAAQRLIKEGNVHGCDDKKFLKQISDAQDAQFLFVFSAKGVAPVATGWIMPRYLGTISVANSDVQQAQLRFAECMEIYGSAPWLVDTPLEMLSDEDLPTWGD